MPKSPDVNPLAIDEDYFIEAKEPDPNAPPHTTEDIEYFLRNLWRAIKMPKEYLEGTTYLKDDVD